MITRVQIDLVDILRLLTSPPSSSHSPPFFPNSDLITIHDTHPHTHTHHITTIISKLSDSTSYPNLSHPIPSIPPFPLY